MLCAGDIKLRGQKKKIKPDFILCEKVNDVIIMASHRSMHIDVLSSPKWTQCHFCITCPYFCFALPMWTAAVHDFTVVDRGECDSQHNTRGMITEGFFAKLLLCDTLMAQE